MKKNILVVAAHPDDEILGCGGTLAKYSSQGHNINILFLFTTIFYLNSFAKK